MKFNANPRQLLLLFCFFLCLIPLQAQEETAIIRGSVKNQAGESLVASRVYLEGTDFGAMSDEKGFFEIQGVTAGSYRLAVSRIGSESYVQEIVVSAGQTLRLKVRLTGKDVEMDEVEIEGETQSSLLEKQGFSVEAIDTRQLQIQSIDINRVLDRTAGVRVRRSGGMGSDFIYSLNGMTGNAIRFFIDGVPMDYFGSSYSINNFPTTLLERVEIYKGVVPVSLGSDALGGVVNLVTDQTVYNFLEASYSFGSFNTHQAVVSGQWKAPNSGLTTRLSAFYNYSDNDYGVWGRGVTYATPETGFRPIEFTEEDPAIRFNDDFRTANAKVDIGFTNQSWADQIFVGAVISDLDRGIQHGQTMGTVFGDIRYTENFLMPFLTYRKEDLGIKGLNTDFFLSLAMKEGINTDTSTNRYDWRGEVININSNGGELSGNQSRFTLFEDAYVGRWNTTYELSPRHKLGMNFTYNNIQRDGEDDFAAWFRIPLVEPQSLQTLFGGLSLESNWLQERLTTNAFVKYYGYEAAVNEDVLIAIDGVQQTISRTIENQKNTWGGGLAAAFKVSPNILLKLSAEQATRLPSATEALGDGITIWNNPFIQPEQSFNVNLGTVLGPFDNGVHSFKVSVLGFYRDTKDQLLFTVLDNRGNGAFINIAQTEGKGVELDFNYSFRDFIEFTANATYLDIRNNQSFDILTNQPNIVYRDRLRNTPYLMANAGFRFRFEDVVQEGSRLFAYLQSGYVHEYFLGWPSLGSQDQKNKIPTQLVFDAGVGYTFPSQRFSIGLDLSNALNEQVYDNFLLQKPGRAVFGKLTYRILSDN